MNKADTYSFLITTMLVGMSQTGLGNLHDDILLSDDLSALSSSVDFTDKWNSYTDYSYNTQPESNSSITFSEAVDIYIVQDFGKKLADSLVGIDPEIQKVIDEHFWEML